MFSLLTCVCECDSGFALQSSIPLTCLWAKNKNKKHLMEIMTVSQRRMELYMSQCTHTRAQDLLLYTQEAACCPDSRNFAFV